MKLPLFKRINKNDFSAKDQGMIETLAFSLNVGLENLHDALNKKLTFKDNFLSTVKEIEVEVDSSGIPKTTLSISLDFSNYRVLGTQVLKAENLTNSSIYPSSAIFISFQQSENTIIIKHLTGLQANNRYRITVVVFAN